MKLYFSPGACSLSPHIVLRELGYTFDMELVDLGTKKTQSGADYLKVNPAGYVPALALDDGEVLTEGPAILQYLADSKGGGGLLPAVGDLRRYRVVEWLNFISAELHKTYAPLFAPGISEPHKAACKNLLARRYPVVEQALQGRQYLAGDAMTLADPYLFVVTSWARFADVDIAPYSALRAFQGRMAARPAVQAALKAEGLL
ncbi:MAG TPA: glutathione transferase GstA [Burkholderiales bacterium]|nr:glutathione transferase GstA [Burkholderiales bacterium]